MTPDIKTRLAEIKTYIDDSNNYLISCGQALWLIDQLEQALATNQKYKEALEAECSCHSYHPGLKCPPCKALQSSAQGKEE